MVLILRTFLVVTTDGILLTKAGTMTGGTTGGMEARSNKWDDKKIERLCYAHFNLNFLQLLIFISYFRAEEKKRRI